MGSRSRYWTRAIAPIPPGPARVIARRAGRWLSAALALTLASCTTVLSPSPTGEPAGFSSAGNPQHSAIVAAYGGVYSDTELERTLVAIVGRLVASSDDPNRAYAITILNAAAVNAIALPEGYLYVTRGLLTLASDSSEIAAVFAHEMAHITADHATERRNQALTAAIVDTAVQDVIQDPTAAQTALTTSQQTLASFSRQQELQADLIGIATVARAGYDPYAAARFLASMSRYEQYRLSIGIRQDQRPAFLASHPSNQDRINAAIAAAQAYGPAGLGVTDRNDYLSSVNGIVFGDDRQQGYVRGRNFLHADLAIGFAVPDGFVLDNTQEAVLATGANGTALRFDAVGPPPDQSLTDYLLSGWINGLEPGSVRAETINGLAAASASAAASGWHFRVSVIRVGTATYRFIFANDRNTSSFDQSAAAIAGSFRQLTAQETASLRPLRIRIVTIGPNDTFAGVASRMRGVDDPADLLAILNALEPGTLPEPGSRKKIVTD